MVKNGLLLEEPNRRIGLYELKAKTGGLVRWLANRNTKKQYAISRRMAGK